MNISKYGEKKDYKMFKCSEVSVSYSITRIPSSINYLYTAEHHCKHSTQSTEHKYSVPHKTKTFVQSGLV